MKLSLAASIVFLDHLDHLDNFDHLYFEIPAARGRFTREKA